MPEYPFVLFRFPSVGTIVSGASSVSQNSTVANEHEETRDAKDAVGAKNLHWRVSISTQSFV